MATDFGTDLGCVFDLDPRCSEVSGRRLLAEAIARRLITPRGMLIDDPNYGIDVFDWLYEDVSKREIAALASAIQAECKDDERVEAARVTIVAPPKGIGKYTIEISLEDADGPFDLVLAANTGAVTLEILKVG